MLPLFFIIIDETVKSRFFTAKKKVQDQGASNF